MSAAMKGFYFRRLRDAGVEFERHYREYTLDELLEAHQVAVDNGLLEALSDEEIAEVQAKAHAKKPRKAAAEPEPDSPGEVQGIAPAPLPVRGPDPEELAGMRQNTKLPDDVIRVDEQGRQWLQEEVQKPAYPKPRGRRVLRYNDPGTKEVTVQQGEYTETFEVAGDPKNATPSEVKVTLPSYQVGIYRDPRFPFKVITYNGNSGFDRKEVQAYYGGDELVPAECKRKYVENVLCYDMRSVIRQIQTEYRQLQLAGRVQ